jgi:dephospho-CoA kinase
MIIIVLAVIPKIDYNYGGYSPEELERIVMESVSQGKAVRLSNIKFNPVFWWPFTKTLYDKFSGSNQIILAFLVSLPYWIVISLVFGLLVEGIWRLVQKGWQDFSLSDEIREVLKKESKEPTRDNLIARGNELREEFGPQVLAERIFKKIKKDSIITSIRNQGEIEFLKEKTNFYLIFVDAPIEERYKRSQKRLKKTDFVTFEEFKKQEQKEKSKSKNKQQLDLCKKCADYIIINNSSLRILNKKIKDVLRKINEREIKY